MLRGTKDETVSMKNNSDSLQRKFLLPETLMMIALTEFFQFRFLKPSKIEENIQ